MKPFVSVWVMTKQKHYKKAFTLIEVMVAVMIISVVLASMLKLFSNNSYLLQQLKDQTFQHSLLSLFVSNERYGFETKETTLYSLIEEEFEVDDALRRELEAKNVKILYRKLKTMDLESMQLELGETILRQKNTSQKILRVRL